MVAPFDSFASCCIPCWFSTILGILLILGTHEPCSTMLFLKHTVHQPRLYQPFCVRTKLLINNSVYHAVHHPYCATGTNHAIHRPLFINNYMYQPCCSSTTVLMKHDTHQPCYLPMMLCTIHAVHEVCCSSTMLCTNHSVDQPCFISTILFIDRLRALWFLFSLIAQSRSVQRFRGCSQQGRQRRRQLVR